MNEEFNHKHYNYKWTKGFLLALCITLLLLSGAVLAQNSPNTPSGYSIDSTTGNLIQNPTMTSGTGWTTSGMTGSYTPDGYIFSYSSGTIEQNVNFNAINFGYLTNNAVYATGIMYGFKYRFQCANQIGATCETGTLQDTLNATFTYTAPNGTIETTSSYGLGLKNINDGNPAYNPVWQQLAETYTFTGPKNMASVGSARLSITGMDAGFWACNPDCYGPQIKDAYMRLNYSVDPCILNPAFNSNCPGFQNVLQGSKSPTFYYSYNIAQSLPHIGGGVVLHGYDYGFNWYNYGACYNTFLFWCTDWRTDGGGNINFRISDKNNTTMLQNQWYVGGNNSGGSYSNRFLFTESRNSLDMGSVQWWASDVWNHFGWVGWTRPIWTPDPCYTNGLYSPNCSNFKDTLNQVLADVKAQQEKIAALSPNISSTSSTPSGSITVTISDATTTSPSVTVNTTMDQNSFVSTNRNIAISANQNPQDLAASVIGRNAANNARVNAIAQRAMADANNIASASTREAEQIADNLTNSSIVSSMDALKETDQASSTITIGRVSQTNITSTVQHIAQAAPQVTPQQKQEQVQQATSVTAITIESAAQLLMPNAAFRSMEISVSIPSLPPVNNTARLQEEKQELIFKEQEQTQVTSIQPIPSPDQNVFVSPINVTSIPLQASQSNMEVLSQPSSQTLDTNIQQIVVQEPRREIVTEVEQPQQARNFTTDKTNPINDIIENRTQVVEQRTEQPLLSSVNRNAQNNEVAGGVDINNLAVLPVGFSAYNIALKDVAFYAPKEIYRNQKTVDNVRALRSLASDRLHQEMVDQQYLPR